MFFSFEHKIYLAFLFAVPLLIFLHFYGLKNIKAKSLKFANFEAIARIKGVDLYSKGISLLIFNIIFVVILVFALSGLTLNKEMDSTMFSYVIAIDASESMGATDIPPDRLTAAKEVAVDFIDSLPYESYISVLSFSGDSTIESELTKNKEKLKEAIMNIETRSVGGTDLNEAVWNSMRILKNEENKAVIILSDGQINVGELQDTIDDAIQNNIIIHTIGIGTLEGGEVAYGLSKLDESSLKALAYNTEGKYFQADSREDLKNSFKEIVNVTRRTGAIDLTPYLIMALLLVFIIKQYLITTQRIMW